MEVNLFKLGALDSGMVGTTTDTAAPLDYVESYGNIVDSNHSPIDGAHWQWYNTKTGEVYAEQQSSAFHVWGDTDLDNVALRVMAHGFHTSIINATDLLPQMDVVLKPVPYLLYLATVAAFILFIQQRHKKVGAITAADVTPWLLIGGGLLAFGVVEKILQALGILKSPETKNLDALSEDPNSFWSPNYYLTLLSQNVQWTTGIDTATADQWIQDIKDAMGFFGDSEATIIGILKRCRTQATFSFLAWEFNYRYGGDFLAFLRGRDSWYPWAGLSDTDIYDVSQYISKLPKF